MTSHSYPADCLKTNLRKFAALWAKKGQKAGFFAPNELENQTSEGN